MTIYRLKPGQETIEIVDGDHAGKRYERGKTYTAIPENEAHRFEDANPPQAAKPAKTAEKPEASKPEADITTAPYALEPDEDPTRKNGYKIVKR